MPRVLVADDNPLTLGFFEAALAALGFECTAAAGGVEAVRHAAATRYDLLLIDACMPDMDGIRALRAIRAGGGASCSAPALASTAAPVQAHAPLRAAGFVDVVPKPIALFALRAVLAAHVPGARFAGAASATTCLDDAPALAATGGDGAIVSALRDLLDLELAEVPNELHDLVRRRDFSGIALRLHRLAASAGFCGATALGRAVESLRVAVTGDGSGCEAAFERFLAACADTRVAVAKIRAVPRPSAPTH